MDTRGRDILTVGAIYRSHIILVLCSHLSGEYRTVVYGPDKDVVIPGYHSTRDALAGAKRNIDLTPAIAGEVTNE